MTSRDVAIAGCGPGGLAAALVLHRAGHAVTLYERFDQPQPSGTKPAPASRRHLVFHDGGTSAPVDLVIDAMGSRSPLSSRARDLEFGALWTTLDRVDGPDAARLAGPSLPAGRANGWRDAARSIQPQWARVGDLLLEPAPA